MAEKRNEHPAVSFLYGHRTQMLALAAMAVISAFIIYLSYLSYQSYRKELTLTEEEQLLTMARTVGTGLVTSVEQELENIDLYFDAMEEEGAGSGGSTDSLRTAAEAMVREKNGLYDAVICLDSAGGEVFRYGETAYQAEKDMIVSGEKAVICGKWLCPGGWYEMFISRDCAYGGDTYTFLYVMNLDVLRRRIVAPVQIGRGGYSVVKDSDLAIIMHHAPSQIGMDAIYDRQERYPQLDLSDLFRWVEAQRSQEEGYDVIHSYVWDDPDLAPQKRIVAYTTIHMPGEDWIVNSTLPYEELNEPLSRMIGRLAAMTILFLTIIAFFVYAVTRRIMKSEGQKREIAYLKEINKEMELLRHKDEEIQHYQRIQSVGQMSSHIAHEFNNYLTPVMVYGEILESDDSISPENQELIHGILTSVGEAADLSRKLLDFSRQDRGTALGVINLREEVQAAMGMIGRLTPENITLKTEILPEELYIRGKRQMTEHLLMNLCNNAFHAMEKDGGILTVRLETLSANGQSQAKAAGKGGNGREKAAAGPAADKLPDISELPEGNWAVLTVSDTGCGISPEVQDKVFEPFYTTKRSGKGTGLGLSVVRNTVMSAGGRISLESRVGEGTTFRLYFPLLEKPAAKTESEKSAARRVAVVDDDPEMLKAIGTFLKSIHCRYECFDHPAAFLARIQDRKDYCDVLITDYSMPVMNGLELSQIVRQMNPQIRLILISGMDEEQFDWHLKNNFIDEFILKSEITEKLAATLS